VRPETGLTVVTPKSYKIRQLPDPLEAKERWILDKLAKYGEGQPLCADKAVKSGDEGASHRVLHQAVSCLFEVLTYDTPVKYNGAIEENRAKEIFLKTYSIS